MSYPNTQLLIDGEWQDAADGRTLPVFNPATGAEIGRVAHAGIADLDRALAAAQKGFEAWRDVPAIERGRIMRRAAGLMRERADSIAAVLTQENGKPLAGKLNFAASSIDPKLGTLQLRAELANGDNSLLPGQFVRVKLITGERDGVFLVPQTAVLSGDKGKFVFVVGADGKAEPHPVQTGDWQGKDWVILGGLKAGDKIITDNLMKVRPGAPVKIQPADAKPDAGKPQAGKA